MARKRMSPEDAKAYADAKREKVRALMASAMGQLTDPAAWQAFLTARDSLSRYSIRNQMLIFMQHPNPRDVAGYVEWQDRGRQVRRGETGILIYAPVTRKAPADGSDRAPEPGEPTTAKVCGVKVTSVFDISQTDPVEGKPFRPAPNPGAKTLAEIRAVVADVAGDAAGPILAAMDRAADLVAA